MNANELIKKNVENVDFVFDQLDTQRRTGLLELKSFQQVKRQALTKEKVRLAAKLGPDHQRVAALGAKIRDIDNMGQDLDVLITEADIKVESVDENTWKIHGKVMDKDRKGVEGLTAALYDGSGKWQREIGYGNTNDQGYFSISCSTEKNGTAAPADKELFLYILNKNRLILYRDDAPVFVMAGKIDYRAIVIAAKGKPYSPPEPVDNGEKPDSRLDTWTVKGSIVDAKGKPVAGLTVSLFDKEHVFDNYLGTAVSQANGSFAFAYKKEELPDLLKKNPDIYLQVLDKAGQTVYTSKKVVKCKAGKTEEVSIKIKGT